ncbi:phosphotransferase family protein [Halovivax gelatinilyticus]|uniref:phosphotransferase family protein n=1 Tax=Halovivax gelatinilyticus TaxID=2961597 RepID=UPI0020CA7F7F|nr:phosphotransferase [Halovivax gelatinilyticus]
MTKTARSTAPASVERIVADALGTSVERCERPAVGSVSETFRLALAGSPSLAICKLGGANVWIGDVIEPEVVRLVGETTDLPVPAVLATGSVRGGRLTGDHRWAIYECLDGSNPDPWYRDADPRVRRRIVTDAGDALGRLHAAEPLALDDSFSGDDVTERPDRTGAGHLRHAAVLERTETTLEVAAPASLHGRLHRRLVESVSNAPSGARPVLTHGDFHPGNLLVSETGALSAVLDWGNAHVTRPEYAIARAEVRFVDRYRFPRPERERLRARFRAAYRGRAPLDRGYPDRASAYKRRWLVQSAANLLAVSRTERGRTQLRRQLATVADRID